MFYKIKGISAKSGKGTVSVVYRQAGCETVKATGVAVAPADFDLKSGRVKSRVNGYPEMNSRIQEVTSDLELAVRNVKEAGIAISKPAVDAAYSAVLEGKELKRMAGKVGENLAVAKEQNSIIREALQRASSGVRVKQSVKHLLTDKITDYIKEDIDNYREPTKRGFLDLVSLLKGWDTAVILEDVNLKTFQDFQKHLVQKDLRNGSVRSIMQRFRTIYRKLIVGTSLSADFLKDFKGLDDLYNDDAIYLTPDEVEMIAQLPLTCKAQKQIRLQFLLGCEVGLRHKDLVRLTPNHITGDTLTITTYKKNRTVKPPITNKARAILAQLDLPVKEYHINYYNKVLRKVLQKIPHFHQEVTLTHYVNNRPVESTLPKWQLVASHTARKTAINNWLAKGVRESVAAQWAGHKDIKVIAKHYANKDASSAQELHKVL